MVLNQLYRDNDLYIKASVPDHVEAFDVTISVVILKVGSSSGRLVGQAFFFPLAAQVTDLTACISLISVKEQSFAQVSASPSSLLLRSGRKQAVQLLHQLPILQLMNKKQWPTRFHFNKG